MKQFIIVVISLLSCVLCVSLASAQVACPAGTQLVINMQTNEAYCLGIVKKPVAVPPPVVAESVPQQPVQNTSDIYAEPGSELEAELARDNSIKSAMRSSGWELGGAIGYAYIAQFDIRLVGGYHIQFEKADGMSLGIYGELGFQAGLWSSLQYTIVPMLHIHGETFRVGIGLGLGGYKILGLGDYDGDDFQNDSIFEIVPEIRFDWFLSEHIMLGARMTIPLMLFKQRDEYEHDYGETLVEPKFVMDIHFGYKF